MTKPSAKPAEIKKLNSGKLAVRWEGKRKFEVIEDDTIAQYLMFLIIKGPGHKTNGYGL